MTPNSAYIDWLDMQIENAAFVFNAESYSPRAKDAALNRHFTLKEAREKFLSLYPLQEVDNDEARQFTDGLD